LIVVGSTVELTGVEITDNGTGTNRLACAISASNSSVVTVNGDIIATSNGGTDSWSEGVLASTATVTVKGNITSEEGAIVSGGNSAVTVEGTITADAATYVNVGGTDKTMAQYEATSTKPGYLEYKDGTNIVWVKAILAGPTAMTLAHGYAATSTAAYSVSTVLPVMVTQDTDHGGTIVWNNVT